ncbi:TonB-dependent siderophore receptor [Diaphorobacter sp. HDW4B]|uniref:TonB-dependent siderophore receptor n=1 Tax=Diaphorobacter sp. HDW4B TaxID=2714925 RepID=UPI001F106A4E|nr:TonB-dependent siderophore receptor [Diaphorobacter sp. HDW4B]
METVTVIGTVQELQSLDFYAPNSSAVLRKADFEEMGARKLDQALQYQAGVLSEPFGGDNKVEWFKIRGFDASVSLDGTPTTPNGYFVWKPEIFGVESAEVLKGPNALVFGAAQTGGVVNLVTKRPHKERALELNTEAGNRGRLGLSVDYNNIANEDGTVYYRLVAQARKEDGMQRGTDMKSYYFAPSVTMEFSPRTSLTLLASVQREDGTPTNGFLPAYGTIIDTPYGRIDRRLNPGEPGADYLKRTQASAGWMLSHQLNSDWKFAQNYKYTDLDLDQMNTFAWGSDNNRQLLRGYTYTNGKSKSHYFDNRISGKLRLSDSVQLLPVVGIDYLKSDTDGLNNGFGYVPGLDMFNPVYGTPFSVAGTPYGLHSKQWGAYASTQMRVGNNWNFNAGIRHDSAKNKGAINGGDAGYDVSKNSLNFGAMYISDIGVSPYFNYSESFKPVSGVDGYGNTYRPYEGQQREVGVKLEPTWLNGGNLTLAYFDIKEKNALISDASNIQSQTGKRTNKGIELQGNFKLGSNTSMKAAYTHNDSRQDLTTTQTLRTPLIPDNQASLWLNHSFDLANNQKLTVGAGARYNGQTEDQRYYPGQKISGYTLLDLMVRYDMSREWALQFNARNLTDKTYVSGCDFYCYYGAARTVDVQLQYKWK